MCCLCLRCKQFEIYVSGTVSQLLVKFFLGFSIGSLYFVTEVLNMDSHPGQATEVWPIEVVTIKIFSCVFSIIIIKLISLSFFSFFNQDRQPTSTRCP